MPRPSGPWPVLALTAFGTFAGVSGLEIGARIMAISEERLQGRLDRDLAQLRSPSPGAVVTLGQMIRKSENPRIVYELRPRLDVMFAKGRVTTSDAGHRGLDVRSPKPRGTYRILGIGDSYMFGQGVSDEETYLARLPALLRAGTSSGQTVEAINLAVPGFNSAMEAETLRVRGAPLEPDLILLEIVGNDLDLPNFLWNASDPWTLKRMYLFDFVRGRLRRNRGSEGGVLGLSEAPHDGESAQETFSRSSGRVPAEYASMVGLPAFKGALADVAAFGRAHRVPVRALTHGVWFEEAMLQTLSENKIPVLVLRSALRQRARSLGAIDYARSPLARSPADLHPSALGHQVIAEELATWLQPQIRP